MKNINLLIKNGIVYDGTGAEPFEADIGITPDWTRDGTSTPPVFSLPFAD